MQRQLLEFMSQRSLAAISGVAGSGKTILAMAKAQELARNGMRTLFLCFNKPLKDWIKKVMQDDADDNLMVNNYHGLALHLCQKAGIEFWNDEEGETPSSFWDEDVPDRLMSAMSLLGEEDKFDAIVVDEGRISGIYGGHPWIRFFGIREIRGVTMCSLIPSKMFLPPMRRFLRNWASRSIYR